PLIGADRAWNELGITGAGVGVAIIDTGIDATHADLPLGSKVVANVEVAPDLFGSGPLVIQGLADTDTTSGHGTHVSSIVGGTGGPAADTLNPYCVAPSVICVAAGAKDGATLADFSSRGAPDDPLYHPTLTAPGVNIAAARATTGIFIDTFFATDLTTLGADA